MTTTYVEKATDWNTVYGIAVHSGGEMTVEWAATDTETGIRWAMPTLITGRGSIPLNGEHMHAGGIVDKFVRMTRLYEFQARFPEGDEDGKPVEFRTVPR